MVTKSLKDREYYIKLSDIELVSICIAERHNELAWKAFFIRFDKRVVRLAVIRTCKKLSVSSNPNLVNELVHEVFVHLYCDKLRMYKAIAGKKIDSWLSVVTCNFVRNFVKSARRLTTKLKSIDQASFGSLDNISYMEEMCSDDLTPEEELLEKEVAIFVKKNSTKRDAQIFEDFLAGYQVEEIVERRGLQISSKRVYHIIEDLRKMAIAFMF